MTQQEFQKRYQYNPTTDCLGEGGFGKVYKAYDNHLDKYVAIKIAEVKTSLEQVRLKHEVELVNKLPTHPYIANYEACYTYSSFTGELDFAVLQYYEEGNLEQLVRSGKLTDDEKDALLRKILEGIGFLHDQGIIHRDLKPQNILIVNRNGQYIPKITDFGISKKLDANKSSVFTNSLAGAGTLAYASPEQLMGKTIKKNTDLWSFGVIVCYVYLGKLPFNIRDVSLTSEAGRIELYKSIVNGLIDLPINQFSTFWYNIVKQCLIVDNEKRINKIAGDISTLTQNNDVTNKEIHNSDKTIQLEPNSRQILEETKKKQDENNYSTLIVIILIIFGVAIFTDWKYFSQNNKESTLYAPAVDSVAVSVDSSLNNSNTTLKSEQVDTTTSKMKLPGENDGKVTDIDGNIYHTVKIGIQTWMLENLKTTHYNDGTPIEDRSFWLNPVLEYGHHYKLTNTMIARLAPKGWHIPSKNEWQYLCESLDNNLSILNLPKAGFRGSDGGLIEKDNTGYYLSSTFEGDDDFSLHITEDGCIIDKGFNCLGGRSVRCIKDTKH